MHKVINHFYYELVFIFFLILSLIPVTFRDGLATHGQIRQGETRIFMILGLVFHGIFLLDMIVHLAVYGKFLLASKPSYRWEAFIQLCNIVIIVFYIFDSFYDKQFTFRDHLGYSSMLFVTMLLRTLILVRYIVVIEDGRAIVETAGRLAGPFINILFAFYLLSFEFQVMGQYFFSGKVVYSHAIAEGNAAGSTLNIIINFNDWYGSFMVLTCLLVSNNWNSMVDLYCLVYDYPNEVNWPKAFFSVFYFLVALIILNIIISFVLELYDSLGDDIEKQFRREKNLQTLARSMPYGEGLDPLIKRMNDEVARQIIVDSQRRGQMLVSF